MSGGFLSTEFSVTKQKGKNTTLCCYSQPLCYLLYQRKYEAKRMEGSQNTKGLSLPRHGYFSTVPISSLEGESHLFPSSRGEWADKGSNRGRTSQVFFILCLLHFLYTTLQFQISEIWAEQCSSIKSDEVLTLESLISSPDSLGTYPNREQTDLSSRSGLISEAEMLR